MRELVLASGTPTGGGHNMGTDIRRELLQLTMRRCARSRAPARAAGHTALTGTPPSTASWTMFWRLRPTA